VSKENHEFVGWKCPDGSVKKILTDEMAKGNSFYVAQWKPTKHKVTFHGEGGKPNTMVKECPHGQALGYLPTLDENKLNTTKMLGWFKQNSNAPITGSEIVNQDMDLYARWQDIVVEMCTVTFYQHNGESVVGSRTLVKGSRIGNLPESYERVGYDFQGWYTEPDEGGENISSNQIVSQDLNLYARWEVKTYTITWNPNYSGSGQIETQSRKYGEQIGILPGLPRTGYVQNGWWTSPDGGAEISPTDEVLSDMEFYAHWTAKEYQIEYDLNGGSEDPENPNPRTYDIETPTFQLNQPIWTGHDFSGWTGSNGTVPKIQVSIPIGSIEDKSYLANWDLKQYVLSLDANGGTVNPETMIVTFSQPYGELPTPERTDWSFVGWFTQTEEGDEITPESIVVIPQDHAIHAHWSNARMTLTFNPNGGELPEGVEDHRICWIGQPLGELPTPTKTGYVFNLWWSRDDDEMVGAETIAPEEDMELVAKWRPIQYSLRFDANGG